MKCPQCPHYEQKTSYGIEIIKCNNEDCPKRRKPESEAVQAESEEENDKNRKY